MRKNFNNFFNPNHLADSKQAEVEETLKNNKKESYAKKTSYENSNNYANKREYKDFNFMKENQNPNEILHLIKAVLRDSDKQSYDEPIKNPKTNFFNKELNSIKHSKAELNTESESEVEPEAEFVCTNYLSKAADERRKKLYTNDDGSLCDKFQRRNKKLNLRKLKPMRRNFKNKISNFKRNKDATSFENMKENGLKMNLVNDRQNGVYIVRKNIDKLLDMEEKQANALEVDERILTRTPYLLRKLKYLQSKNENKKDSAEKHEQGKNNSESNKPSQIYNKINNLYHSEKANVKRWAIEKNLRPNSKNKKPKVHQLSKANSKLNNSAEDEIKLVFNCKNCSKAFKSFVSPKAFEKPCHKCPRNCKLIEIQAEDNNKLLLTLKCPGINCKARKIIVKNENSILSGGPECFSCNQSSQITTIKFKEFVFYFKRYSVYKCLPCNFNLEIKQKKKYLSKNGFLMQNTDDNVKCSKCSKEMNYFKDYVFIKNCFDYETELSAANRKNFWKEAESKENKNEFSIKNAKLDDYIAGKSDEVSNLKKNKAIKELECKGLSEKDVFISPIKKEKEGISILNLNNDSYACYLDESKLDLNKLKSPAILKNHNLNVNEHLKLLDKSFIEISNLFILNNNYYDKKTSKNPDASFLIKSTIDNRNNDNKCKGYNNDRVKRRFNDF